MENASTVQIESTSVTNEHDPELDGKIELPELSVRCVKDVLTRFEGLTGYVRCRLPFWHTGDCCIDRNKVSVPC